LPLAPTLVPTFTGEDALAASLAELKRTSKGRRKAAPKKDDALSALANVIAGDDSGPVLPTVPVQELDSISPASESEEDASHRRRRRGGRRRSKNGEEVAEVAAETPAETPAAEYTPKRARRTTKKEPEATEATAAVEPEKPAKPKLPSPPKVGAEAAKADEAKAEEESVEGTRRRRRRRRRGEDVDAAEDEPDVDVVVKVREPRKAKEKAQASEDVTGIEGSTRMEAKKQRRREGRSTRRRAPILAESEFLARRENVDRMMLIRQAEDYAQIAVLEDGVLVEHYVDRASANSLIGNIYLGRVQNVLPSMEAAFIDIGRGRNAVLYSGEVDWEAAELEGAEKKIESVFTSGQAVIVQVSKDPVGTKGARLTAHISIPGRYIVYSPSGHLSGVSRKLPDGERHRLKEVLDEQIGENASVIVRTAAEGASEEDLTHDVNRVKAQWEVIEKRAAKESAPSLLYSEPDLTIRIVRDLFNEDFSRLVIDGNGQADDAYDTISAYIEHVAPSLTERLVRWDRETSGDLFDFHRVQEQVMKALERKVFLPSGGSLVIDRTEAMTVIDVNTGRFTGSAGNLEATVTANNLEAAEEIVRQLRLRDIGGIIVIDFIDMVLPSNRELLLRRLIECLGRDRTRHQVAEVTSLGLVQMTRKKVGTGLAEAFTVPCETCGGRGYHIHDAPVASQAPADGGEREMKKRKSSAKGKSTGKPAAKKRKQ
jgi:ribonuclease E